MAPSRSAKPSTPSASWVQVEESDTLWTDHSKWRLKDDRGKHTWHYLRTKEEDDAWPQSTADKYYLGLDVNLPDLPAPKTALDGVKNGLSFFEQLQLPPGNWGCEYGGPMFLLPGIVITWYATNTPVADEVRIEISRYLYSKQNSDGGWGLHIEGDSTVFGTAMNYTVLRLLGQDPDEPRMARARAQLHGMGGAVYGPHWAKFWLSVLGVMEWEAVNPLPPELWLLPDWMPIAPWRWWIHIRQVFLPMSFIWSQRWSCPLTPLLRSLREELYTATYNAINFAAHRNSISPRDNYHPKTALLNSINWFLVNVETPIWSRTPYKKYAEDYAYKLIQWEDEHSDYACLAPVNAPMNTVCCYIREGAESYAFRRHIERLPEFLWLSGDGMMCNGTNGVQTWDTAFAVQAVVAAGLAEDSRWRPMMTKALEFLEDQQMREEPRMKEAGYRHTRKGAWGFSNRDQGYTVSDCVAEALKAVLQLQSLPGYPQLLGDERIHDSIDVLLSFQNADGGCASYERVRGSAWLLEKLNAAEVFGNIMVEYNYPECTTAVVTGLIHASKHYPDYRAAEVKTTVSRAIDWIRSVQRPDGSWYGSWGICFTYATMFALESLAVSGETCENSERADRACNFLIGKQNSDGGWGESYRSCEIHEWVPHPQGSQVVQTAWACIALMEAESSAKDVIERGLRLILRRQRSNGEWKQEGIEGVFNKTCMISYPNYKFIFPIKALGMWAQKYGDTPLI